MRVLQRNHTIYLLAFSLCITLSGLVVVANGSTTQAKSIPEAISDLLTGRKDSGSDDKTKTPVKTVAPTTPVVAQPTVISEQKTATTSAKPATTSIPATNVATTPKTADTSVQARAVATAQSVKTNAPLTYTSSKITDSERNDLYKVSLAVASIGGLLYLLSFAPAWHWFYRNAVASSKTVTE